MDFTVYAQEIPETERNQQLIETAERIYKDPKFKNIYHENAIPEVKEMRIVEMMEDEYNRFYNSSTKNRHGATHNQKFYIVNFSHSGDIEKDTAKVYIWDKTKKTFAFGLGNTRLPLHDTAGMSERKPEIQSEYYSVTYSKDFPYRDFLPRIAKYGDTITIVLNTEVLINEEEPIMEQGYKFNPIIDLKGGKIISDSSMYPLWPKLKTRTIQIKVMGNVKLNVREYRKEYKYPQ